MRKSLVLALVLVSCLAAAAGGQTLVGVMNGASEAPGPGDPDGFGLAGFRFEGTTVSYAMQIKNIAAPNASHIHRGAAGVPGQVVIALASAFPDNKASGSATASAALIEEIRNDPEGFYVNVHNTAFPNGAIRAQLSSGAFAVATGAAEVPGPGDTDGAGMAVFTGGEGETLNYAAIIQNIDAPNASHIHRGASTVAGPVVIDLASAYPDNMATGAAPVSQALLEEVVGNPTNFYFNVHNAAFPGGAVRGALSLAPYSDVHYFPIVGRVDGLNNTRFVADVRILNGSSEREVATLEFFSSTPAGLSAASAVRGVAVEPGAELVVNDVVGSQFSANGLGALKIGTGGGMTTGVRVFNDQRPVNGGTTGFFIKSKGIAESATSGVLLFLSQASTADIQAGLGFRSNVGWFNPNPAAVGANFQARRASDGSVIGSVSIPIDGLSQAQQAVFQLLATVPVADQAQSDFYISWTSTGPLFVYGAVVDNKTGDVVYVD
jgi:CHRD domain-containing protein